MIKAISLGILLVLGMSDIAFAQSNDESAVQFSTERLQTMFQILKTQSSQISPSCIESLKNLKEFKTKVANDKSNNNTRQEINVSILRSLYANSIQLCEVDVQKICSHRVASSIRKSCKELLN
ncbi:hypothetical protein [Commensalibacter oyaizuii]|uniref:Uncharacterized protein n=1 Tax=Commensalibacter oyaizuii TaxID=3043873 RepID=A0ABT6PZI0_9PROT|nr:hypothetical protein [Commensalibacter sp. TBRC 16381]MDI2090274.1 hypothetical protein [Commensalibacter sp. TBRC 16381]